MTFVKRCGQAIAIAGEARPDDRFVAKMAHVQEKPILFVDIDGVISLWGFGSNDRPAGAFHNVDGVMHFLSWEAGKHLLDLSGRFELVWCSGWEEKADEHLVHVLALPERPPFLTFSAPPGSAHWKLETVARHAGDRPLAWIDDTFDDSCRAWAAARPAPTLLVATDPAVGLAAEHVTALERWARGLTRR